MVPALGLLVDFELGFTQTCLFSCSGYTYDILGCNYPQKCWHCYQWRSPPRGQVEFGGDLHVGTLGGMSYICPAYPPRARLAATHSSRRRIAVSIPYAAGFEAFRGCWVGLLATDMSGQSSIPFHHHLVPCVDIVPNGLSLILGHLGRVKECARRCEHRSEQAEWNQRFPWNRHLQLLLPLLFVY